jgi:hypothetical protein
LELGNSPEGAQWQHLWGMLPMACLARPGWNPTPYSSNVMGYLSQELKFIFLMSSVLCIACHKNSTGPVKEFLVNKQAVVFVFLAADCPLSQSYTLTLNRLHEQFQPSGVAFYGVFSGNGGDKVAIDAFVSTYNVKFPVIPDPRFALADHFGATKTPEVFAVNSEGTLFYKGAIDNWASALGQHRIAPTENYLLDALNGVLQHRTIHVKETEAVGCFLERR